MGQNLPGRAEIMGGQTAWTSQAATVHTLEKVHPVTPFPPAPGLATGQALGTKDLPIQAGGG